MKYESGRLQNVLFCFVLKHSYIKISKINIPHQSLTRVLIFFQIYRAQCEGTLQSQLSGNVTLTPKLV